jgi:hypothetical protein
MEDEELARLSSFAGRSGMLVFNSTSLLSYLFFIYQHDTMQQREHDFIRSINVTFIEDKT